MSIQTINPATAKVIETYEEMAEPTVNGIIESTHTAYLAWRETGFSERKKCMLQSAALLRKNQKQYATLLSNEMGKPISAAIAEIEKCASVCEYYAQHAEDLLKPRVITTEMKQSQVVYRPLGIIFAIMPWNFPFWQVFRFAAPNLMAGNAGLLSHAPISTGTALAIESLLKEAGFPENLFRSLIINNDVAAFTIKHPKIVAVTLTGSERAGSAVGATAAGALKKVVLELGGSDPYVILADADLELAAEECVLSRMNNTGQVCISAKRLIIVDAVYDAFEKMIIEKVKRYKMADPMDENTNFGPMARADLRDEVHQQVQECLQKGASLITGGEIPQRTGFYYPPTILNHVTKGMPAYDEEIFGPVIGLIRVKDENEAIEIANDSRFGLAGAVFTKDIEHGLDIATNKIHAGTCYVNGSVASDPRLPFGGIKSSGYGRELSQEGIHEFVNTKTIAVKY
jgi:succinate-semialdehyde dehydrogenase / glutarate-semialdehyde dehydrogenase